MIEHYESQDEDEAVAEDEAAFEQTGQTVMEIPTDLVPIDNFINHDMAAPNRSAAANCNYRYLPCAGKTPAMS